MRRHGARTLRRLPRRYRSGGFEESSVADLAYLLLLIAAFAVFASLLRGLDNL
ncbi:MAG: hypothetical protein ABW212_12245 [Pseudonocardia sediminis]